MFTRVFSVKAEQYRLGKPFDCIRKKTMADGLATLAAELLALLQPG